MQEKALSLYEGLRTAVEERCTIEGMRQPTLIPDNNATEDEYAYKAYRPRVDTVTVFIRMKGMWLVVDITIISAVFKSVMIAVRDWCTQTLRATQLEVIPSFDEATSLA